MRTATVFDLDDTLVDSGAAWGRACGSVTARHGHRWGPADDAVLHGNGDWPAFVAALCGDGISAAEAMEECTAAMAVECAAGRVPALPGARGLVTAAERHGPVAVATASPRRYVHAILEELGLAARMSAIVCAEDVVRGKPAPDAYLRAAAVIGIPPSECMAVEDSANGIRSAVGAGMRVLAIPRAGSALPADVAGLPAAQARDATSASPLLSRLLVSRSEPAHLRPAGPLAYEGTP
ncbi:HAD family hydrolase [Streptomyces sp. NBC_01198]|uniref:HAD family hydrolase n=1 Tax=Streptomyces sp. NBC_01198 TaxID=2903769 RepID=UPI002E125B43|nr:HAD-IA family hydrolase [Streptomyces sp. NBC_01198]